MNQPGNNDIDQALETLPDQVADALTAWRMATLEREKTEALLHLKFKGEDKERTATEIKAMVQSSGARDIAVVKEIKAEGQYTLLMERLMAAKKRASLRTAF